VTKPPAYRQNIHNRGDKRGGVSVAKGM
jgi:hypothetical protein